MPHSNANIKRILYAGDTDLNSAASDLAGIMSHYGLDFDYRRSDEKLSIGTLCAADSAQQNAANYDLYIISDYPVNNCNEEDFKKILTDVENGAGLLMLGGWESYHGLGGDWDKSPLAAALPVIMQDADDRVNSPVPCLIEVVENHPIISDLPFDRPPAVGGYNRFAIKPGATEVLSLKPVDIQADAAAEQGYRFNVGSADPLLVTGQHGKGRTACLATDVAPHWVGTLVDWGPKRVNAQGPNAEAVEIGNDYAKFFYQLLTWTMGE